MKRLGMLACALTMSGAFTAAFAQAPACPDAADVRWMPAAPNAGEPLLIGFVLPGTGVPAMQVISVAQTQGALEIDVVFGGFVGVPPPFHALGRFPAGDYAVTIDVARESAAPCPSITTALTIAPTGTPLPAPVPAPMLSWQGLLALLVLCTGAGARFMRRLA